TDNGATWSVPIRVADSLAVGTRDPDSNTPVRDSTLVPQIAAAPNGSLYIVWQDGRFSNGARDGIALSRSNDGGLTWSAPAQINSNPPVAAFSPFVHVRRDGMIGVTYFDFRSNTPAPATLPTDYWLARTTDAATWQENRVAQFDLAFAPRSNATPTPAYFIGDYHALTSIGALFVPFFVQTNNDNSNRTDVFAAPAISATSAAVATEGQDLTTKTVEATTFKVVPAGPVEMTSEFRRRISDNIVNNLDPAWYAGWKERNPAQ
ncbi:MAG: sialidase family protein, partial [Dokdonella sp.]